MLTLVSLPNKIPSERLVKELKDLFHPIGECYVKTNRDRVRDLPAAFVQFEVSFGIMLLMFDCSH